MSEIHIIEALALLNVVQFFGWGLQVHKLINKLMCRDFAEYKYIQNGPPRSVTTPAFKEEAVEEEILAELNGMLGSAR